MGIESSVSVDTTNLDAIAQPGFFTPFTSSELLGLIQQKQIVDGIGSLEGTLTLSFENLTKEFANQIGGVLVGQDHQIEASREMHAEAMEQRAFLAQMTMDTIERMTEKQIANDDRLAQLYRDQQEELHKQQLEMMLYIMGQTIENFKKHSTTNLRQSLIKYQVQSTTQEVNAADAGLWIQFFTSVADGTRALENAWIIDEKKPKDKKLDPENAMLTLKIRPGVNDEVLLGIQEHAFDMLMDNEKNISETHHLWQLIYMFNDDKKKTQRILDRAMEIAYGDRRKYKKNDQNEARVLLYKMGALEKDPKKVSDLKYLIETMQKLG